VIGGGDIGSDCIGTAVRQRALSITHLEILPRPPERENKAVVWPEWPLKPRTSSSQEEGCERDWPVLTERAVGRNGRVTALECVRVVWANAPDGRGVKREIPDGAFTLPADLVLLAMGFLGPKKTGMLEQSGVALDRHGNVLADRIDYRTSVGKVSCAGASRSSSGRSAKAGNAPAPSTRS
jgi:glutamate synthase (NADPH/NADH) small chain